MMQPRIRAVGISIVIFLGFVACFVMLQPVRHYDTIHTRPPVIGLLAVERGRGSYIAASYVKFLETAGANVIPIFINTSLEDIRSLFHSINGVVLPGGGASLLTSNYSMIGQMLLRLAIEANQAGDYFPLLAECLGFELIIQFVRGGEMLRSHVNAEDYIVSLNLTSAAKTSRLFSLFPSSALDWIAHEPLTANYHRHGVTMETFRNNPKLTEFFTLLSTNMDRNGVEFVSTIESKKYPIYGVQWHPEKNEFENVTGQRTNHSEHAVTLSRLIAKFFVQEARKSSHRFASMEMRHKALIQNYKRFLRPAKTFKQKYIF